MPLWLLLSALVVCLAVSVFLLLVLPWGLDERRPREPGRLDFEDEDEAELVALDAEAERAPAPDPDAVPPALPRAPRRTPAPRAAPSASRRPNGRAATAVAAHPLYRAITRKMQSATLSLPCLPRSASNALARIASPDSSPDKVARSIQTDPALTAHVLRVANSTWYAAEAPVTSLELAIVRLGLNTVKDVTVAAAIQEKIFARRGRMERDGLLHATLTAAFAREIAALLRSDPAVASLAGLLHDVGVPAVREACLELAAEHDEPVPAEVVAACVDEHHAAVGGRMATAWSLPPAIVSAIAHHHDALALGEPHRELALSVQLASELARWAREHEGDEAAARDLAEGPLVQALQLSPEDVERLLAAREDALRQGQAYLG